ncbi:hypothetical protein U1Q18_036536 [Sarracenia purpurea var. burkii]
MPLGDGVALRDFALFLTGSRWRRGGEAVAVVVAGLASFSHLLRHSQPLLHLVPPLRTGFGALFLARLARASRVFVIILFFLLNII